MDEIDLLQAEIMRTLAHPRRLQIIHRLVGGPVEVGRIALDLGISQPNASQHLAVMRTVGVVEAERTGREVRYRLSDPDIVAACATMRGVLGRRLERLADIALRAPAPGAIGPAGPAGPVEPIGARRPAVTTADPTAETTADLPLALATASTR